MDESPTTKPERLAEKLLQIRTALGVSQSGMVKLMSPTEEVHPSSISAYESGKREPPPQVLEAYARCAKVATEVLVDDEVELPRRLMKGTR